MRARNKIYGAAVSVPLRGNPYLGKRSGRHKSGIPKGLEMHLIMEESSHITWWVYLSRPPPLEHIEFYMHFARHLAPFWLHFGPFWLHFGRFWLPFGSIFYHFGSIFDRKSSLEAPFPKSTSRQPPTPPTKETLPKHACLTHPARSGTLP